MSSDPDNAPTARSGTAAGGSGADPRRERLARALRDNLKKRKAQQRRRRDAARDDERAAAGDDTPGGR
jgi:hypothetical protein